MWLLPPVLVATGGAVGSVLRYLISTAIAARLLTSSPNGNQTPQLPWGTMAVNIMGSFIIGVLVYLIPAIFWPGTRYPAMVSQERIQLAQLLFVTGFCGGFTTFSTATIEAVNLARAGHLRKAITSVIVTIVAALAAITIGIALASQVAVQLGRP